MEQRAAQEDWESGEYSVERDILNAKFCTWIPIFSAYSAVILLHSIVETQLRAFAEHMGEKRDLKLRVKDMAGRGVEQSALYLDRVPSVPVKMDSAWCSVRDLQSLRNIIVHRGGKSGERRGQKKEMERLVKKYPQELQFQKADGIHDQLWVSMKLCRSFVGIISEFFERVFKSAGLPNRYGQLGS